MGQALYRKYRSKSLDDIVGQEHITKTLKQAIKSNRVSHAYLFTGPRGVGKTSIARILAHDINNLDYTDDSSHVDIIEIDAASNRRIDEIRDLREKVYIAPTIAKYKVYIIDEVHMLTKEAFNALLKTLEEPPAHVIFILATTDAHKLPETIISRTQRFQFKPIDTNQAVGHLKAIAKEEKIQINDDALKLIAEYGQGSFRDSIGLLDQAANYTQPITVETINGLLGTPSDDLVESLLKLIPLSDTNGLVISLNNLYEQGYPASIIASKLSAILRKQLIEGKAALAQTQLLELMERLIDVPASRDPEHFLEICLLKSLPDKPANITVNIEPTTSAKPTIKEVKVQADTLARRPSEEISPKAEENPKQKPQNESTVIKEPTKKQPKADVAVDNLWPEVLNVLKAKYNTLYGLARMANVDMSQPGVIKLQLAFPFHQKRINDAKNRDIILAAVEQVSGNNSYILECVVDPDLLSKPKPAEIKEPDLSTISNIFGGGEVIGG